MKTRRWLVVAGVTAVAGIVALVALFAGGGDDQPVSTDATTTTATTVAERVTTTTTATTTTTERVTTTIARTAADDLAGFFSSAAELDRTLKAAAAAINAGMTETEMVVDQAIVDLVQATREQIPEVKAAIPAGMEPDLLRATLPVFSDLVSRSYAMSAWTGPHHLDETVTLIESNVLSCLSNGSEAAARYPADLAALRTLAQSSPPVAVAAPDSRAAEDLAVHLENVENGNSCCEGCGGYIATELAEITYEDDPTVEPQTGDRTDGYLGPHGIPFQTDYEAGVGWTVEIFVG